ncbi:hypothetical protein EXIGLDRAFT_772959 [Exidia glandulosa HHB12029]|uniref:Uncharacterized protein n=1 Tax=Exidia glandulosa HHB12029 TaxID=1314781 RepID=A0A165F1D8_EXIGL|nr:hypothetical protein EXIGLDRAFT_772959 [Exidia glandulosa HHB12029]
MSSSTSTFISTLPTLSRACSSDSIDSAAPRTPPAVDSHPRIFSPDDTSLPLVEELTGKTPEHQLLLPLHPQRKSQSPEDSEREFLAEFDSMIKRSDSRPPPRRSLFTNLFVGVYNLLLLLCNIKDYAMQAVAVAQLAYHGATIIFKMRKGVYKPSNTLSGWLLEAFCSLLAVFIWRFAVFMTKLGLICVFAIWVYRACCS